VVRDATENGPGRFHSRWLVPLHPNGHDP
jgi:hypothetical protein